MNGHLVRPVIRGYAVNWDAEKFYRVEGLGPFDEF